MQYQLTCEQVNALMPFYLENKLTEKLSNFVKQHLQKCPTCMQKYNAIKNALKLNNDEITPDVNKQYDNYINNLSAYIDNELNDEESLKMKKYAISNPIARKNLENIYTLKRIINLAYEKTKQEQKTDYSKLITNQIIQEETDNYNYLFKKLFTSFTILISILVLTIIAFLYF